QFQLHPLRIVYAGPMLWPLERASEAMQFYRDFITEAPDDLNGFFAFLRVPLDPLFPTYLHHQTMCGVVWCYTGPVARSTASGCAWPRFYWQRGATGGPAPPGPSGGVA